MKPHPHVRVDRPHEQKPTHISVAVAEAMKELGVPMGEKDRKPAPAADSKSKKPSETPDCEKERNNVTFDGTPDISNNTPPPSADVNATKPPARKAGRPRSNRIEFFAVDSFLRQNPKFIKLKRELSSSEEQTWVIVTSLFCYVAQNQALTPRIDDIELFAEFCYWGDSPEILIQALQNSSFLTKNLEVTNWFQNQPFATKKLRDYDNYMKKKQEPK